MSDDPYEPVETLADRLERVELPGRTKTWIAYDAGFNAGRQTAPVGTAFVFGGLAGLVGGFFLGRHFGRKDAKKKNDSP